MPVEPACSRSGLQSGARETLCVHMARPWQSQSEVKGKQFFHWEKPSVLFFKSDFAIRFWSNWCYSGMRTNLLQAELTGTSCISSSSFFCGSFQKSLPVLSQVEGNRLVPQHWGRLKNAFRRSLAQRMCEISDLKPRLTSCIVWLHNIFGITTVLKKGMLARIS